MVRKVVGSAWTKVVLVGRFGSNVDDDDDMMLLLLIGFEEEEG